MERKKQNFENYPELTEHIERMASTGRTGTGSEWCDFLNTLNEVLSLQKIVERSEQLPCDKCNETIRLDVNNFENYTADKYRDNLLRLGVISHSSLVGKTVYYSQKSYGKHKVVKWDEDRAEFLLDLDGQKFWSNPFRIQNCG